MPRPRFRPPKWAPVSPAERAIAAKQYAKGKSLRAIATILHRPLATIAAMVRASGVAIRPRGGRIAKRKG